MPYDDARNPDIHADAPPRRDAPQRDREQTGGDDHQPAGERKSDARKSDAPSDAKKKRNSPVPAIVLGVVVVVAAIGGVWYWLATKDQISTDDAYTDGRAITIAPQVGGYVSELDVTDNQYVKKGQIILRIDERDYVAARDQARGALEAAEGQLAAAKAAVLVAQKNFPARLASAQAKLQSARASLINAQSESRRQHAVSRGATTQQQVDQADANLMTAQANVASAEADVQQAMPVQENIAQSAALPTQVDGQVAQARAQLAQAELNIGYAVLRAPQDGWVTKRNVEMGNYLTAGASVMSLVSPEVWITANFKENQLDRMRPGQHVDIEVDAYPGLKLKGHVDSVQLGSGSRFSAFPAENATGNYVKIVQRVPVKIVIDSGLDPNIPMPLGLSADPVVYVK